MTIDEQQEWLDNHKDEVGEWILVNDKWYGKDSYEDYLLSDDPKVTPLGIYPPFMTAIIEQYEK